MIVIVVIVGTLRSFFDGEDKGKPGLGTNVSGFSFDLSKEINDDQ